ncbi:cytochrome c biogenesis protein CcdA [Treponema phagedenis]|uniref:cytochrome c biogenesis protein CcdA n=1 Tax=Treponema phagedenis TaxID=162 RepID=UPI0001F639D5|nr:cytochrome c biogenesis protein CcdA [Treponema phagedenis]EFW37017.1 cytochrome C biogenesis protein transmembrane region [Treponema phagedenis F0421]TYT78348.1 cytochrome C biogenesis protein CcdA [Treponema phagedenis]
MNSAPGILGSLLAGLLSFLSPCVLPLIPVYLSFISGESVSNIREGKARLQLFFRSLFFVLGFTAVFVLLSLLFGGGMQLAGGRSLIIITRIAGGLVILLGINIIFDFIPFLRTEQRGHTDMKNACPVKAFLFGMLFAAGWTPCIGPILSSILFYAASSGNALYAALLLAMYSLGLGLPFLLVGLFFDKAEPILNWFKQHMKAVKIISGILIIIFGILMLTSGLAAISRGFLKLGFALEEYSKTGITPFKQIAGFLARWFQYQGG